MQYAPIGLRPAQVILSRLPLYYGAVRFEHTVFALPFAYLGMVLAAWGWPGWSTFLWITVAMTAARTIAMASTTARRTPPIRGRSTGTCPRACSSRGT